MKTPQMNKYSSKFSFRQSCLVTTYLFLTTSGQNTQQDTITYLFIFLLRYSFMQNDATKSQNSCASKTTQLNATQGNIYMGTRYLDPKYSRWISNAPALGEYIPAAGRGNSENAGNLPGMGGIYNHINGDLYHYAGNNPVKYTDPTGMAAYDEFDSIEAAVKDWAMTYADDSIYNRCEYASSIFSYQKDGKTIYTYNTPVQGAAKTSSPNIDIYEGAVILSAIHSHGSYDPDYKDEVPSKTDIDSMISDRASNPNHEGKEYVVTPAGFLKVFDTKGNVDVLSYDHYDLPYAPIHGLYAALKGLDDNSIEYERLFDEYFDVVFPRWEAEYYKPDERWVESNDGWLLM